MKNLKFNANEMLQRSELKTVIGGREDEGGGPCSIYDTDFGSWIPGYTVEDAQYIFSTETTVTGYCCATC